MAIELEFVESNFEEVLPIWREVLWPNRQSKILPANGVQFLGGYNTELEQHKPHFFALKKNGQLIGATSFFHTHDDWGRLRGNIILPEFRGKGFGCILFANAEAKMKAAGLNHSWSLIRKPAANFYQRVGYQIKSDWIENEYEFGPNAFAHKPL